MSGGPPRKSRSARIIQAAALTVVFGVLLLATRVAPEGSVVGPLAALGFLLLAGTLTSELIELVGLPQLTGFILAGVVSGPYVLHLIDKGTLERVAPANTLALALIALAGGLELKLETLRTVWRSIAWHNGLQSVVGLASSTAAFVFVAPYTPFAGNDLAQLVAIGLLWAVVSISRSPAALLGILAQTRAKGPLATHSLAFVMSSDVVVILISAITVALVRPVLEPGAELSLAGLGVLGHELVGSAALGVTLGLVLAAYLRLVGGNLLLVLLAVGVGLSELLRYIQFDALLAFLVAGFVVENFSSQGEKLLHAIESTGSVVFVVFFALAGANLDLFTLADLWPVALSLSVLRVVATIGAARVSSRIAQDPPAIRTWGWSSMISQAGLSLGLAALLVRAFPALGEPFRALVIASSALNTVFGPILFKLALDKSGESRRSEASPESEGAEQSPTR